LTRSEQRRQGKTWKLEISFMEEVYLIDICVDFKADSSGDNRSWMNTIGTGELYDPYIRRSLTLGTGNQLLL
jgi:hypothetical protein